MNRNTIGLLAMAGSICLIAAAFVPREESAAVPAAGASTKAEEREPAGWHETNALTLTRDSSGQFHIDVRINNDTVNFLVDTGADMVALTVEDADNLGLSYGEMQPIMQTASGVGYGAPVMIDELEVNGMVLRNVEAIVAQDLPVNLLGQSVLRELGSVELSGDRMVLRAR